MVQETDNEIQAQKQVIEKTGEKLRKEKQLEHANASVVNKGNHGLHRGNKWKES